MEFIVLAFIAILVIAVVIGIAQGQKINDLRAELEKEFPGAKIHVSHNDTSFLVVDFATEQIVLGLEKLRGSLLAQEPPYRSQIPFSAIVKAEIMQDGTQLSSTNRGSQAIGAAVGAVALGGVGALIGGLSASSTSISGTKHLSLRITVDDPGKPIHDITFYDTERKQGGKRGEMFFDQGAQQMAEFAAHVETAIRTADAAQPEAPLIPPEQPAASVAAQIGELWKLKEAGALTQDEFEAQKARLINGERPRS